MNVDRMELNYNQGLAWVLAGDITIEDAEYMMQPYIDYKNSSRFNLHGRTKKLTFTGVLYSYAK